MQNYKQVRKSAQKLNDPLTHSLTHFDLAVLKTVAHTEET
jgi:hypothetical protein